MLHFSITMGNSRNITDSASSLSTPLTTRSIVLSLLLGSHPPVMPVSALVEFCGLFDVAPGTVRTALSRMVDRGELTTDDASYSLSGRLLTRQREQDTGRRRAPAEWDGEWHVVIVTAERRTTTERRDFRARAIGSRLGELRPDIWMRPANIEIPDLPDCLVTRARFIALRLRRYEAVTMAIMSGHLIEGDAHSFADLRVFSRRSAALATTPSLRARAVLPREARGEKS